MNNIHFLLSKYLLLNNYSVSVQALKSRIFSDPGNGVVAITNTLDYFDIEHIAATVPKEALSQLPQRFVCQLSNGEVHALGLASQEQGNVSIVIDEHKQFLMSTEEFLTEWTGFIIAIEKNTTSWIGRNRQKVFAMGAWSLCIALALSYSIWLTHSIFSGFYLSLSLIGLLFSYLTFEKKIKKDGFASRICNLSSQTDCDAVLKSNEALLFRLFDLSDLSIVYFSFTTIAFLFQPNHGPYLVMSALTLPFTIYSLYSQYFQLKKWCPLCLGIVAVLILQFLVIQQPANSFDFAIKELLPFGFIFGLSAMGWRKLKALLLVQQENKVLEVENLTFRRNHDMFLSYYHSLKKIDDHLSAIPSIKTGSSHPLITLTVVTDPLCRNCAGAHLVYQTLLEKHPESIQLEFLFLTPIKNSTKALIAQRLLQIYYEEGPQVFLRALDEWYDETNVKKWFDSWQQCSDGYYAQILHKQLTWVLQHHIESTPTLLINGRKFPQAYRSSDIENFIAPVLAYESKLRKQNQDIMHDKTEALNVYK